MINLMSQLEQTKSTNEKIDILKSYRNNERVKEAIRLCYEPFIHTYMIKVPKPKRIGKRDFYDSFEEFRNLFLDLDARKITGNNARDGVFEFLNSVDVNCQKIYTRIIQKDLKVGIAEKTVNKAFGDNFVNIFEVQLGYPYDPERKYKKDKNTEISEWYASRKLDGIRGYKEGTDCIRTRSGNKIHGFDHILNELNDLQNRHWLFFIDGELYKQGLAFQTITSYVNADVNIKPEHKEQIKFYIFGIGFEREWKNTNEMVSFIRDKINWSDYKYLVPIEYEIIKNDPDSIYEIMNRYFEEGYEGAMLRHPFNTYSKGRSHDIVKAKPFYEGDFKVINYEMGKEHSLFYNTLGALIVEGEYKIKDKVYKIKSEVGSGYKIKPELGITRDQILNDIENWIDTIIEVKFQGITDKVREDGTYGLRFPVFVRQRIDKRL